MASMKVFVSLAMMACMVGGISALSCYSCESKEDGACGHENFGAATTVTCNSFCLLYEAEDIFGNEYIGRGCGDNFCTEKINKDGPYEANDRTTYNWCCDLSEGDNCNSATTTALSVLLLTAALGAAIFH